MYFIENNIGVYCCFQKMLKFLFLANHDINLKKLVPCLKGAVIIESQLDSSMK